jgi:hypothetical protein
MAELGVERHFQVVDGVRAMSVEDGLKWAATSSC